ncbi:IMP dehydrogenase, partial [Kitasatospora sp. NPDC059747]
GAGRALGQAGGPLGASAGVDSGPRFARNVAVLGGVAPARAYIPELLPDVLSGAIDPGLVFDRTVTLDGVSDGYRAMDDRSALKVRIAF